MSFFKNSDGIDVQIKDGIDVQIKDGNKNPIDSTQNALNTWLDTQLDDNNDMVAIGDGSGNKLFTENFPGITKSIEQKTDNSAFNINSDKVLSAIAAMYQVNPITGTLSNGNVAAVRSSMYRALLSAPDQLSLTLLPSSPVPAGSDITKANGAAIDITDFQIRDTAVRTFIIPTRGWKNFSIYVSVDANFDQALTCGIRAVGYAGTITSRLLEFTIPANTAINCGIGAGEVGVGGAVGDATATSQCWYNVPVINAGHNQLALRFNAATAPSNGSITNITIVRRS